MRFQAGDWLASLPQAQNDKDIDLLSAMLRGFDDDTCIKVPTHLARASGPSGARVAAMEVVLPELKADIASASFVGISFTTEARIRRAPITVWARADLQASTAFGGDPACATTIGTRAMVVAAKKSGPPVKPDASICSGNLS